MRDHNHQGIKEGKGRLKGGSKRINETYLGLTMERSETKVMRMAVQRDTVMSDARKRRRRSKRGEKKNKLDVLKMNKENELRNGKKDTTGNKDHDEECKRRKGGRLEIADEEIKRCLT